MNEDPKVELSPLSQKLSSGGRTVEIEIYRLEGETSWFLEIVDEFNNSTVWDEPFDSDSAALIEAKKSILQDRITTYIGPSDGKPGDKWR